MLENRIVTANVIEHKNQDMSEVLFGSKGFAANRKKQKNPQTSNCGSG